MKLEEIGVAPGLVDTLKAHDDRLATVEGTLDFLRERGTVQGIGMLSPEAGEFVERLLESKGYTWNGEPQPDLEPDQPEAGAPQETVAAEADDAVDLQDDPYEWQDKPLSYLMADRARIERITSTLGIETLGPLYEALCRGALDDKELLERFDEMFRDSPEWQPTSHPALAEPEPAAEEPAAIQPETQSQSERINQLEQARTAVCETSLVVHQCQQNLESAKAELKEAEAEQKAAVARLASLESDEGQLELFDRFDGEEAEPAAEEIEELPSDGDGMDLEDEEPPFEEVEEPHGKPDWRSAPVADAVGLTKAQAEKFADAGVTTMGDFEDLRYGRIKGPEPGKGLRSIKRIGADMEAKLIDRANEWLQVNAPDYDPAAEESAAADEPEQAPQKPPKSRDFPTADNPATVTVSGKTYYVHRNRNTWFYSGNPNHGWIGAGKTLVDEIEAQLYDKPQSTAIRDQPKPKNRPPVLSEEPEPAMARLAIDVPGFANESEQLYAGTEHEIVDWLGDKAIVRTASGKTTVLKPGEYEEVEADAVAK